MQSGKNSCKELVVRFNLPYHGLTSEICSPHSSVLLFKPNNPSFCTGIHFFKTFSPWPLHLPSLFLTFLLSQCKWLMSQASFHLPSSFLPKELKGGGAALVVIKSHNQKEITLSKCTGRLAAPDVRPQLSTPPIRASTCSWPVPLPSPSKSSPSLHSSISSLSKPCALLLAVKALTQLRKQKSLNMIALNFLSPT